MADTKTKIILSASDETRAAFESAKRNIGSMEAPLLSLRNGFNAIATSAVVSTVIAFGKAAIDAAEEAEQAQLKLQAVYKATGGAVGFTTNELNNMADAMADMTHFDDESIRNGMSEIIKFGNVTGAVFKDSLKVIADYAAFSGQEFPAAASAVAQALAGPESAAKLLKTAGVILTEQQKDLIKSLKDAGDEAGAQRVILTELEGTYSGMEAALNSGLTGATKALNKEWGNLLETFGKTSGGTAIAERMVGGLASAIHRVRESIDDASTHYQNSVLFNKGKGAAIQLSAPGAGDTGPLAGKTIADVQAVNAAIAATQKAADDAAAAKFVERMKKLGAETKKLNEEDDKYWIEKAKKEYDAGEKQTFDLVNKQQERFVALREVAEDAEATDLERAQLKLERQLTDLELERQIMAADHELTLAELAAFEQAKADIINAADAEKLSANNKFHMTLESFAKLNKLAQLRVLNEGMLGEMAIAGTKYRAFFELNKIASTANAVIKGWDAVQSSYAFGAAWGGPVAGAAMAAISAAATAANIAAIQGASFGGGIGAYGAGGGSGGGPIVMPSPLAPEPPQTAQRAQGIIVSINLGDDTDMPGAIYVRKLIGLLNEQIRDGVTIDQIRVN